MKENKKPENVSAFPALHLNGHEGMTLRDYFAAKALTQCSMLNYRPRNGFNYLKWLFGFTYKGCSMPVSAGVENAYIIADAMLKQRES
jgi:hypothetical protein